jgi:hypothetical protein
MLFEESCGLVYCLSESLYKLCLVLDWSLVLSCFSANTRTDLLPKN